jgi:hypothetical protein
MYEYQAKRLGEDEVVRLKEQPLNRLEYGIAQDGFSRCVLDYGPAQSYELDTSRHHGWPYRSIVAMKGETRNDAQAAAKASAPTRKGRLVVFHFAAGA